MTFGSQKNPNPSGVVYHIPPNLSPNPHGKIKKTNRTDKPQTLYVYQVTRLPKPPTLHKQLSGALIAGSLASRCY